MVSHRMICTGAARGPLFSFRSSTGSPVCPSTAITVTNARRPHHGATQLGVARLRVAGVIVPRPDLSSLRDLQQDLFNRMRRTWRSRGVHVAFTWRSRGARGSCPGRRSQGAPVGSRAQSPPNSVGGPASPVPCRPTSSIAPGRAARGAASTRGAHIPRRGSFDAIPRFVHSASANVSE